MTAKSVLTKGEGLFDTHVHLEDVQYVISKQMESANPELLNNAKLSVVGDGNGFMSQVLLVNSSNTSFNPSKFIIKIASCLHFQQICEKFKSNGSIHQFTPEMEAAMMKNLELHAQELHNREVSFYEIVESWNAHEELLTPKLYFANKFDAVNQIKGFMGMEFVEDTEIRHLYENVKVEELYPILKSLAFLQAKSLSMTPIERESIGGFDFERLTSQMLSETGLKGILDAVRMLDEERLGEKVKKLEDLGMELVNFELARNLNRNVSIEHDVLVHGDLWSANILWKRNEGSYSAEKIIDYQLIHFGNPAEDLVRLFLTTLSGSDRRTHWEQLLEVFYNFFITCIGQNTIPYTLDQLKQSYRCYFVTGGLVVLPMFGPVAEIKMNQVGTDNAAITKSRQEVLLEKAECLLEDIALFQRYNLLVPKSTSTTI